MSAFDARRPPDPGLIDDCVHCGFCLPTCPTYVLWGEEMDSPRGRIVLMRHGFDPDASMDEMAVHFDRCLGCMACVTACPSGVRYDRLIEAVRPQVERHHRRPLIERAFRAAVFALFTHPGRLRAVLPALIAARALGLPARAAAANAARPSRLRSLLALAPPVRAGAALARLPAHTPPRNGPARARVGLLQGCVQRVLFADVNRATVDVLAAEGYEVTAPPGLRCCGALMLHSGYEQRALELARRTIAALEDCDVVVANVAGCGSAMKDYAHLLADDPAWAERAARFSARVRDITELLAEEPRAPRGELRLRVAYHDACHLAHAQGVRAQPRALLGSIPGLELVEPAEWELCCGSAGIYNLLQPQAAAELGARKTANLLATEPQAIAAANPGCALQIAAHLRARGANVPLYHPVELLAASLGLRRLSNGS